MTSLLDYWPQTSLRRFTPLSVRGSVSETGDVSIDHAYTVPLVGAPEWIETKPITGAPWWMVREAMQYEPGVDQTTPDGKPLAGSFIYRELDGQDRIREVWHNNRQEPGTLILRDDGPNKIRDTIVAIDPHGQAYSYIVDHWINHIGKAWGNWTDTIRCTLCERHTNGSGHAWYYYVAARDVGLVEICGPMQFNLLEENGQPKRDAAGNLVPQWAGKLYFSDNVAA